MALLAVKHLDPVVGVDVHSVLVTPGTPPVFLPHPHVGFMLDLREYVQAAKAVVGCIAMVIVQEKVTEYIEDHPEDVEKLAHLADEANQRVNDLTGGGKLPDFKDDPNVAEGMRLANEANKIKNRISDDLGSNVGSGGSSGRPIFVNGMMRATAGTHAYHVPGLHFPLGEAFAPPPEEVEPSNDGESFMGSKTVLANNDPMSYMALEALSCWSVGMEPPPHNSAHTDRTYPSMPSSVMLPIPAGRPVLVGGPPIMNIAAAAKGLFKAFRGSKWAKSLADKLNLKSGFLRCNVLKAEPVDAVTGDAVLQLQDFTVPGRLPLVWERCYTSHVGCAGAVGVGWQTPADIRLLVVPHEQGFGVVAYFPDHATAFDAIPDGNGWSGRVYDWQHGYALYRLNDRIILRTLADLEYVFDLAPRWEASVCIPEDGTKLPLFVSCIADRNGNAWVFERRPNHIVTRIVEHRSGMATGRAIECASGRGASSELLVTLTLIDHAESAHLLVKYEHDNTGSLIAAVDAMMQPHYFSYDSDHRMVRHTSARGVTFHYDYQRHDDDLWRVVRAWGDNGLLDYRFAYNSIHGETRIIDSLGHATLLQSNERGLPVAQTDPLGGVTTYGYDAQSRTTSEIDPTGHTLSWDYDAFGNLLTLTLPDGGRVAMEYDAAHKPIRVTEPGGGQWHCMWDERGNLLAQSAPSQSSTRYEYDKYGQLTSSNGPYGAVTQFEYDRNGNLAALVDTFGQRTQYTHDTLGNLLQVINALGQISCYEYDRNGNLTRSINPGERDAHYAYDADGNLVRYQDPAGNVTQLSYSALGQISKRLDADGKSVKYHYDTEEQLIGVINECGDLYQIRRDELGRIVEEINYWGQSQRYEYGPRGELKCSINALGQKVTYIADALGRVVQKQVPDPRQPGGVRTETFSYDRRGQLIAATNPDSQIELCYDVDGRLIEEQQSNEFKITYSYDASGHRIERRTRIQRNGNVIEHTVRYGYDTAGAAASIQIDDADPIKFERDALGRVCVEHFGEKLRRGFIYTPSGQLARQMVLSNTSLLFAAEYAYDANGELIEKRDTRFGIERFAYDPVGRLVSHLDPKANLHRFLYDEAGYLLKTRISSGSSALDREVHTHPWSRDGDHEGSRYTFDRLGNLLRKQSAQQDLLLRWDGEGLLIETSVILPATESEAEATHVHTHYEYDVFHRRTRKITQVEYGIPADRTRETHVSKFFWEGDALVEEVTHVDGRTRTLLTGSTVPTLGPISTSEYDHACEFIYYPGTFRPLLGIRWRQSRMSQVPDTDHGQPATPLATSISEQENLYIFHADLNGEPTRLTDLSGKVVWESCYDAWGKANPTRTHTDFEQPLRFYGQYMDWETGLHYNRHRYFDPAIAQFLSPDPIRLLGGVNLYAYAPNGLSWSDPSGLSGAPILPSPHYFGHSDPKTQKGVRGALRQYLAKHPTLKSGSGNIAAVQLHDGTFDVLHGGDSDGHPERRLLEKHGEAVKALWTELQPCDTAYWDRVAKSKNRKRGMAPVQPCRATIKNQAESDDDAKGLKEVWYFVPHGTASIRGMSNKKVFKAFRQTPFLWQKTTLDDFLPKGS